MDVLTWPASTRKEPQSHVVLLGIGSEQTSISSLTSRPETASTSLTTEYLNTCGAPKEEEKKRVKLVFEIGFSVGRGLVRMDFIFKLRLFYLELQFLVVLIERLFVDPQ